MMKFNYPMTKFVGSNDEIQAEKIREEAAEIAVAAKAIQILERYGFERMADRLRDEMDDEIADLDLTIETWKRGNPGRAEAARRRIIEKNMDRGYHEIAATR